MTRKRFNFEDEYITLDGDIFATAKNRQDAGLISRTLNQLYGKSEELKELVNFYKYFQKDARELEKENKQLKSVVKEVIELLSEEVDVFSDKATEHDINAYVELKELDNKDAYYMATAIKKAIKLLKELEDDQKTIY